MSRKCFVISLKWNMIFFLVRWSGHVIHKSHKSSQLEIVLAKFKMNYILQYLRWILTIHTCLLSSSSGSKALSIECTRKIFKIDISFYGKFYYFSTSMLFPTGSCFLNLRKTSQRKREGSFSTFYFHVECISSAIYITNKLLLFSTGLPRLRF